MIRKTVVSIILGLVYTVSILSTSLVFSQENMPAEIPVQFKVWGTTVPSHTETIVMPAGYREVDPSGIDFGPEVEPSPADKQYGVRPYRCHYLDRMHPRLRPGPAALADPSMKAFAARGEYEPMALGLFARQRVREVSVTITTLKNDRGEEFPAACLDLRWVKFMPNPVDRFAYRLDPLILEKRQYSDFEAGTSAFVWLTAYVPESAAAGVYRGEIVIESTGFEPQRVSVALRVLPFRLDETEKLFSMLYTLNEVPQSFVGDPRNVRNEMIDMREHGMNHTAYMNILPAFKKGADGKYVFDFDATPSFSEGVRYNNKSVPPPAMLVKWAMEVGLDRAYFVNHCSQPKYYKEFVCGYEWNTPEADQWAREHFLAWKTEAEKRGWPPIVHNISDEGTTADGSLAQVVHLAKLAKEASADIQTSGFLVGHATGDDDLGAFGNALDFAIDAPASTEYITRVNKLGRKQLLYNQAPPSDSLQCRYAYGLLIEATGVLGHQEFAYRYITCNPKNDRLYSAYHYFPDGGWEGYIGPGVYVYSWPCEDGLLPNPAFEAIREGVDDSRYIETLQKLIIRSLKEGNPVLKSRAKQFEKELNEMLASFSPFNDKGDNRGTNWIAEAGASMFDHARFRIAGMITELRKELGLEEKGRKDISQSKGLSSQGRIAGISYRKEITNNLWPVEGKKALAVDLKRPPVIDGKISGDPSWEKVPFAGGDFFLLGSKLAESKLVTQHQTMFKVGFDRKNIYLGAHMEDNQELQPRPENYQETGNIWGDNLLEIFLTPSDQWGSYYHFGINSWGKVVALLCKRGADKVLNSETLSTKGIIAASRIDREGWTLECAIPFSFLGLKSPPSENISWGFNLARNRPSSTDCELSSWSNLATGFNEPWNFGALFLSNFYPVSIEWIEIVPINSKGEFIAHAFLRNYTNNPLKFLGRVKIETSDFQRNICLNPGVNVCFIPFSSKDSSFSASVQLSSDGTGWQTLGGRQYRVPSEGGVIVPGVNDLKIPQDSNVLTKKILDIPNQIWQGTKVVSLDLDLPIDNTTLRKSQFFITVTQGKRVVFQSGPFNFEKRLVSLGLKVSDLATGDYFITISSRDGGEVFSSEEKFTIIPSPWQS
ncbi:MAG: glycoside hydrolase domain-containing protein [Candidatus Omnitrophota bacterium]